jgi:hypothetical protein
MEYELVLYLFLGLIFWMLVRLNALVFSLVDGLSIAVKQARKREVMDLTDEMFIREYNRRFSSTRENK